MADVHCPGQDMRYWRPDDIFEISCPVCDSPIEFWKDESLRTCSKCKTQLRNPRLDLGCAKWCMFAKECLKRLALTEPPKAP